jgi:hypothetical protein
MVYVSGFFGLGPLTATTVDSVGILAKGLEGWYHGDACASACGVLANRSWLTDDNLTLRLSVLCIAFTGVL